MHFNFKNFLKKPVMGQTVFTHMSIYDYQLITFVLFTFALLSQIFHELFVANFDGMRDRLVQLFADLHRTTEHHRLKRKTNKKRIIGRMF